MARFYRFKISIDGQPYSGEWTLLMGNRVCVRPRGFASEIGDVGQNITLEAVELTLARIVRADLKKRAAALKQREREVARVNRYWDRQKLEDDHA